MKVFTNRTLLEPMTFQVSADAMVDA